MGQRQEAHGRSILARRCLLPVGWLFKLTAHFGQEEVKRLCQVVDLHEKKQAAAAEKVGMQLNAGAQQSEIPAHLTRALPCSSRRSRMKAKSGWQTCESTSKGSSRRRRSAVQRWSAQTPRSRCGARVPAAAPLFAFALSCQVPVSHTHAPFIPMSYSASPRPSTRPPLKPARNAHDSSEHSAGAMRGR